MALSKQMTQSIMTGLLTAGLFILVTISGLGFLFMFLSIIPLFMSALSRPSVDTLRSAAIASVVLGLLGGDQIFVVFIGAFAMPAWYFGQEARRRRIAKDGEILWRPVGLIMVDLALYACVAIAMIVLYNALFGEGIEAVLQEKIRTVLADLPAEYTAMAEKLSTHLSFLFFSMIAWMWALGIYLHSWLANRILDKQRRAERPSLGVEIFWAPDSLLYFLAVAGLASFIGSPDMQFLGKACLIVLLLPYFFLGIALLHKHSASWPGRGFLLFFLYIILLSQPWAVLITAGSGVVYHLMQLNKRLSYTSNSPK